MMSLAITMSSTSPG